MQTQDEAQDEPQEMADRFDGVSATREHMQACFEYEVVISKDEIAELPDNHSPERFAQSIAVSRANRELDPTFSIDRSDSMAQEENDWSCNGERRYTVLVRFDQND